MSKPFPNMTAARDHILTGLLDMNQTVQDELDNQDLGFTIDQSVAVKQAIQNTTIGVLRVIDSAAQICPAGYNLGSTPFFDEDELAEAYIETINS